MTDFGQLQEHLDSNDVKFTLNGKEYTVDPSAQDVLKFHVHLNSRTEKTAVGQGIATFERVARLVGSKFDTETGKITGGLLGQLMKDGATFPQLNHIVETIHIKYTSGDDLAKAYFETGSLKKALEMLNNDSQENQETGQTSGETSGDD